LRSGARRPSRTRRAVASRRPFARAPGAVQPVELLCAQSAGSIRSVGRSPSPRRRAVDADDDASPVPSLSCQKLERGSHLRAAGIALDGVEPARRARRSCGVSIRARLDPRRQRRDEISAAERFDVPATPVSCSITCCVLSASSCTASSFGQRRAPLVDWCVTTGCHRARPASARSRAAMFFDPRCCAVSETPAVWVEPHLPRPRVLRAYTCLSARAPAPRRGGAVLGDLLEEVDLSVEEEAHPGSEVIESRPRRSPARIL